MKTLYLFTFLLFSSFSYSQLTARQLIKIKQTNLVDIPELVKNYGYKISKSDNGQFEFINDKNIITDLSQIIIYPENIKSEKAKMIFFSTFQDGYLKLFKIQILELGFEFLQNKDVLGQNNDVYQNDESEVIALSYDIQNKITFVKYFTNND